jgi:hypothetical protein
MFRWNILVQLLPCEDGDSIHLRNVGERNISIVLAEGFLMLLRKYRRRRRRRRRCCGLLTALPDDCTNVLGGGLRQLVPFIHCCVDIRREGGYNVGKLLIE